MDSLQKSNIHNLWGEHDKVKNEDVTSKENKIEEVAMQRYFEERRRHE